MITPALARQVATLLQAAAVKAWQQSFKTVMAEAQHRFDADASQQAQGPQHVTGQYGR